MPALTVGSLGEFLRQQRNGAQLSLRQLAEQAGVSNPYLSQIERGLRKPSAEVLQQIAKGLRISAEQLYVRAGILDERTEGELAVESALIADDAITERQKRMLLEIYHSFRAENAHSQPRPDEAADAAHADAMAATAATKTKRPAAKPRPQKTSTTIEGEL